jgi:hypothetical protein
MAVGTVAGGGLDFSSGGSSASLEILEVDLAAAVRPLPVPPPRVPPPGPCLLPALAALAALPAPLS